MERERGKETDREIERDRQRVCVCEEGRCGEVGGGEGVCMCGGMGCGVYICVGWG